MNCKKTPFPDEFMGTVFCCVKLFNDLWVNVSLHYYLLWYYYCLQYCYLRRLVFPSVVAGECYLDPQ